MWVALVITPPSFRSEWLLFVWKLCWKALWWLGLPALRICLLGHILLFPCPQFTPGHWKAIGYGYSFAGTWQFTSTPLPLTDAATLQRNSSSSLSPLRLSTCPHIWLRPPPNQSQGDFRLLLPSPAPTSFETRANKSLSTCSDWRQERKIWQQNIN